MILFLSDFNVIKPDFGLIFWTTIIFGLFWLLVGKFAFGPIKEALRKREGDIQDAIDQAAKAREEMANLKAENEKILAEARAERSQILKDAKEAGAATVEDAKNKAKEEAQRIVNNAKNEIENQKKAAVAELKNMTGQMAITIAEKVLSKELDKSGEQEKLVNTLIDEIKLN